MRLIPEVNGYFIVTFFSCWLFLSLNANGVKAQALKINCLEPYTLVFPFFQSDTSEIHYIDHDHHTFWYKFEVKSSKKMNYQITAVLPGASFKTELFEYSGGIFCKQLVKENLEPLSAASSQTLKLRAGYSYYLGVTNKSTNCGHQLKISQGDHTILLRSTQLGSECANLMAYNRLPAPDKSTNDKVIIGGLKLEGAVFNSLTKGKLNAEMVFSDKTSGDEIKLISYRLKGYNVHLERGVVYQLRVYSMGYLPFDTSFSISKDTELDFNLKPVSKGEKFIIDNIYFYPNTFACKPESQEALEALKDYMLENKKVKIEIQGHTNGNKDVKKVKNNPRSGEEWNFEGSAKELSKLRADKLKEYLVSNGVSGKRITTVGKGGDEMIVPEPKDMKEASRNIRVEIQIISD